MAIKPVKTSLTIVPPWYDPRRWNVNDWASFASIFGTGVFWVLERKARAKLPQPPPLFGSVKKKPLT